MDYDQFVNSDLWNVIKIAKKLMTSLIKIEDIEKSFREIFVFLEDNREFFFLKKFPLHHEEFRKQHFSNRHSVPPISKRTLRVLFYSHFFLSVSLNFLLHATSFFLPFRRVSLPSDVLNYHPSTNFLLLFFSHSVSYGKTDNKRSNFSIAILSHA